MLLERTLGQTELSQFVGESLLSDGILSGIVEDEVQGGDYGLNFSSVCKQRDTGSVSKLGQICERSCGARTHRNVPKLFTDKCPRTFSYCVRHKTPAMCC